MNCTFNFTRSKKRHAFSMYQTNSSMGKYDDRTTHTQKLLQNNLLQAKTSITRDTQLQKSIITQYGTARSLTWRVMPSSPDSSPQWVPPETQSSARLAPRPPAPHVHLRAIDDLKQKQVDGKTQASLAANHQDLGLSVSED